jgi:hypothetical protein
VREAERQKKSQREEIAERDEGIKMRERQTDRQLDS